jgi:hypothetical protein
LVVAALHERAFGDKTRRLVAALFSNAGGRFQEADVRAMVEDAAKKLRVERVVWLDN